MENTTLVTPSLEESYQKGIEVVCPPRTLLEPTVNSQVVLHSDDKMCPWNSGRENCFSVTTTAMELVLEACARVGTQRKEPLVGSICEPDGAPDSRLNVSWSPLGSLASRTLNARVVSGRIVWLAIGETIGGGSAVGEKLISSNSKKVFPVLGVVNVIYAVWPAHADILPAKGASPTDWNELNEYTVHFQDVIRVTRNWREQKIDGLRICRNHACLT